MAKHRQDTDVGRYWHGASVEIRPTRLYVQLIATEANLRLGQRRPGRSTPRRRPEPQIVISEGAPRVKGAGRFFVRHGCGPEGRGFVAGRVEAVAAVVG